MTTTTAPQHHTRYDYDSVTAAIHDAARVIADLVTAIDTDEALLVDVDRLTFLARRAHQLTAQAYAAAHEVGV